MAAQPAGGLSAKGMTLMCLFKRMLHCLQTTGFKANNTESVSPVLFCTDHNLNGRQTDVTTEFSLPHSQKFDWVQ